MNSISLNQTFQITDPVKYVLSPFEGNTNPGYPLVLRLYLQEIKEIDKETDKLDTLVSNDKDIIDNFSVQLTKMAGTP